MMSGGIVDFDEYKELSDVSLTESTYEFHVPGQNFTGPGTHIVDRIMRGVLPTNQVDLVTMVHDIQYLKLSGKNPYETDLRSGVQADFSWQGWLTKLGLTFKAAHNLVTGTLTHTGVLPGLTNEQTRRIGYLLEKKVRSDGRYLAKFKEFNVDTSIFDV